MDFDAKRVPLHCGHCGYVFPWKSKIEKARKTKAKGSITFWESRKFKVSIVTALISLVGVIIALASLLSKCTTG